MRERGSGGGEGANRLIDCAGQSVGEGGSEGGLDKGSSGGGEGGSPRAITVTGFDSHVVLACSAATGGGLSERRRRREPVALHYDEGCLLRVGEGSGTGHGREER